MGQPLCTAAQRPLRSTSISRRPLLRHPPASGLGCRIWIGTAWGSSQLRRLVNVRLQDLMVRVWELLGDVALRPPLERTLEAPPGLDRASTPRAAVGRDQSQPTQAFHLEENSKEEEPLPGPMGTQRAGSWAQGPQLSTFSRVAISGKRVPSREKHL